MARRALTQGFINSAVNARGDERAFYWDKRVAGLGLVVGATTAAYVYQTMVAGKSKRVTIGYHGEIDLDRARLEARKLEVEAEERRRSIRRGVIARDGTETLEQALTRDLEHRRSKGCSAKTLLDYERNIRRYLSDWLPRDLETLRDGLLVANRHKAIVEAHGATQANHVMRGLRRVWRRAAKRHNGRLGSPPTDACDWAAEGKGGPIAEAKLPGWWKVLNRAEINDVLRDAIKFGLFSGLRRNTVVELRWEHVDLEARTAFIAQPKGGEPFTIPLSPPLLGVLRRRAADEETKILFPRSPYVFPGRGKAGRLVNVRAYVFKDGRRTEPLKVAGMPNEFHCLRHCYASAAAAAEVEEVILKLLLNHRLPGGNITFRYIAGDQLNERLRQAQIKTAWELRHRVHPHLRKKSFRPSRYKAV